MGRTLTAVMAIGQTSEPALAGSGALTVETTASYDRTGAFSSGGALDAIFRPLAERSGPLTGTGTFTPTKTQKYAFSTALGASGSLAATAVEFVIPAIGTLTDNFSTQDATKWDYYGTASATGGQMSIPVLSTYAAGVDTFIKSFYNLTGDEIQVEFAQAPNVGAGSTEAFFELVINTTNKLSFIWTGTDLLFREIVAGTPSTTSVANDATNHRWLRFRHSGSTIYWETAPASGGGPGSWTTQRSKTPGIAITSLFVSFGAGYWGTETTPGTAKFDNVNLP